MLIEWNPEWPVKCSKCKKDLWNSEECNVGHGFDIFCNECEESFKEWLNLVS